MRKQKQLAKKLMGFLLTLVMICTLIPLAPQTVKAASDGFYISGTSVYDANGNKFVMRGVNIAHAWYTSETDTSSTCPKLLPNDHTMCIEQHSIFLQK